MPKSHLSLIHGACGALTIHPVGISMSPVLVIFMWASGAAFEAKLNHYENDPFSAELSLVEISNATEGDNVGVKSSV